MWQNPQNDNKWSRALLSMIWIPQDTKNNMIITPALNYISDFQVSKGTGANNELHFMPWRILTPLARQSMIFVDIVYILIVFIYFSV